MFTYCQLFFLINRILTLSNHTSPPHAEKLFPSYPRKKSPHSLSIRSFVPPFVPLCKVLFPCLFPSKWRHYAVVPLFPPFPRKNKCYSKFFERRNFKPKGLGDLRKNLYSTIIIEEQG